MHTRFLEHAIIMQNQFLGVNILYRYLINHIVRFISLFCLCAKIIKLLVFADEHNNIWHEHVVWLWDTELVCFISTIHTSHQAWCKDSRSILIAYLRNKRNASANLSPSSPSLSPSYSLCLSLLFLHSLFLTNSILFIMLTFLFYVSVFPCDAAYKK